MYTPQRRTHIKKCIRKSTRVERSCCMINHTYTLNVSDNDKQSSFNFDAYRSVDPFETSPSEKVQGKDAHLGDFEETCFKRGGSLAAGWHLTHTYLVFLSSEKNSSVHTQHYCSPICARWNNGNSTLDATVTRRTQKTHPLTLFHSVHGRKYFQSTGVLRQLVEECSIGQRDEYYSGKLKKTE